MRHHKIHLALLILTLAVTGFLVIGNTARAQTPIQTESVIRMGLYENQPLEFTNEDGRADGFVIRIFEEIAQNENWQIEYVPCIWNECLNMLEQGEIDLMGAIAYSDDRAQRFDFTNEFLINNWGVLYTRPEDADITILDLEGKTIAMLTDDIYLGAIEQTLTSFRVNAEFLPQEDYEAILQAVADGRADAGIINHLFALQNAAEYDIQQTTIIFNPIEIHFAATKGQHAGWLAAIDAGLKALKSEPDSIYYQQINHWYGTQTVTRIPDWLRNMSLALIAALLIFGAATILLRTEVNRKTADLQAANQRLLTVLDSIDAHVYAADLDTFEVLFMGQKMKEDFSGDFTGQTCYQVFRNQEEVCANCPVSKLLDADGRPAGVVSWEDWNPITQRWYINYDRAIPWMDGRQARLQIAVDITPKKLAEESLKESEEQFRKLFEESPTGIEIYDAQGVMMSVNKTWEQIWGVKGSEIVGKYNALENELLHQMGIMPLIEKAFQGEQVTMPDVQYDPALAGMPGQKRWIRSKVYHLKESDGRLKNVILISEDISQRKQAEQAIQESNRNLEKALTDLQETQEKLIQQERMAAVGQMAAGIAHDFNNIMASIILYADLMLLPENDLPEKVNSRIKIIRQQGKRAADLTQQILDFGRKSVLRREPVELRPFLTNLHRILNRTLPENINITLDIAPGFHMVDADPTRLQQAIFNLVFNARDAMPEGGQLHISLHLMQWPEHISRPLPAMSPGSWLVIAVSDTGHGIPEEILARVFEPFFTTKAPAGSGLGLAQVYGIVEQHNGHIKVDSQPGQGTTFTIYLPPMADGNKPLPSNDESSPSQMTAAGQGELILVVEDDPITRLAITQALQSLNFRVWSAADGREALHFTEKEEASQIALILCDLIMPEMGGRELVAILHQQNSQTPCLILTGYPLNDDDAAVHLPGVVGWLQKPINLENLSRVVSQALSGS